jgi:hypothetical protein
MLRAPYRFPITDGVIVSALRVGLTAKWGATGLTVQPKLPAATLRTRRMVTVRNDSGPQDGASSRRRYGVNVWADSSADAENIALDAMAILRLIPGGKPITATDGFSGPFEVDDDPQMTVATKNLTHFYFVFTASVKASSSI